MPIIKSAKKKMKQDKKRRERNENTKARYKKTLKKAQTANAKSVKKATQKAYSNIDRAVKKGIIHKNKAARLKHQASKHAQNKSTQGN